MFYHRKHSLGLQNKTTEEYLHIFERLWQPTLCEAVSKDGMQQGMLFVRSVISPMFI